SNGYRPTELNVLTAWSARRGGRLARIPRPSSANPHPDARAHCRMTRTDRGRGPGCTVHPGPTVAVHPSPFSVVASTTTGAGSETVSPSAEIMAPSFASKDPHTPLVARARYTV